MRKWKLNFIVLILISVSTSNAGIDWNIYGGSETIQTGDVYDRVYINNDASVDMRGGYVNSMKTFGVSNLNVSGGEIGTIWVNSSSAVTVSKGSIGIITVGSNISDDASITFDCNLDSLNKNYSQGLLIGIEGNWKDGTPFDIQIDNYNQLYPTGDFVQFVPEPATLSMLLIGFGCLFRSNS